MNLLKRKRFIQNGPIMTLTDQGFGFISPEGWKKGLFFHSKELAGVTFDELRTGDMVVFDIIAHPKGLSAVNVTRNGIPHEVEELDRPAVDPHATMHVGVKGLAKYMAEAIARDARVLDTLEWRDLERLIAEVFSGLGFDVELTPGGKDRGKDVILSYVDSDGEEKSYYLEIKHWPSGKKVGLGSVMEFLHVVARDRKAGGMFLASHGFTTDTIESLTEIRRQNVGIGGSDKIVGLCCDYVKAAGGIWFPPERLDKVIFEGTNLF